MKPLHNQLFITLPFSLHTHYFRIGDSRIYVMAKHLHHRLKSSFGKLVDKKLSSLVAIIPSAYRRDCNGAKARVGNSKMRYDYPA
jgi:hypothetical protein